MWELAYINAYTPHYTQKEGETLNKREREREKEKARKSGRRRESMMHSAPKMRFTHMIVFLYLRGPSMT